MRGSEHCPLQPPSLNLLAACRFLLRLAVSCVWSNNDSSVMRQTVRCDTGMVRECGLRPTGLTAVVKREYEQIRLHLQSKCKFLYITWVQDEVMLCVWQYAVICRESLYKILTCVNLSCLGRHVKCKVRFVNIIVIRGPLFTRT
jgi:hypothetical protein